MSGFGLIWFFAVCLSFVSLFYCEGFVRWSCLGLLVSFFRHW